MATEETTKRGRWKEGESGNPNGRKPGTGEVAKLRDSIAAHLPEIIMQLVNKAKQGDSQAARLLLERVLPPMKAIEQAVKLSLPDGEGITAQGVARPPIPMVRTKNMLRPSQTMKGYSMAANLSNRVAVLEKQVTQIAENFHLVCCQGSEPTDEERAEAAQYEHTILVLSGK